MPENESRITAVVLPSRLFLRLISEEVKKTDHGYWPFRTSGLRCLPYINEYFMVKCHRGHIPVFVKGFHQYANRIFNLNPVLAGFEHFHCRHETQFISPHDDYSEDLNDIVNRTKDLLAGNTEVENRGLILKYIYENDNVSQSIMDLFARIDTYVANHVFTQIVCNPGQNVVSWKICRSANGIWDHLLQRASSHFSLSDEKTIAKLAGEYSIHSCHIHDCPVQNDLRDPQWRVPMP